MNTESVKVIFNLLQMSSQACVKALKKIIEEGLTYGDDKLEVLLPDEYQADHDEKVPCKKSQGITSERSFSLDLEALDVDNYDDFQPGLEHCSESAADAEEDLIGEYFCPVVKACRGEN